MKKIVAIVLALACLLGLVGCNNQPSGNPPPTEFLELSEVSGLVLLKGYSADDILGKLKGQHHEDIKKSWGKPAGQLSGFWGEMWELEDTEDSIKYITLYYDKNGYVEKVLIGDNEKETQENWDLIPMVMIDGVLYLATGHESNVDGRCGVMDGTITSEVDRSENPTVDDQSNFGTGYDYQYGEEGTVEILINGKWWVYATEEVKNEK